MEEYIFKKLSKNKLLTNLSILKTLQLGRFCCFRIKKNLIKVITLTDERISYFLKRNFQNIILENNTNKEGHCIELFEVV